MRGSSSFQFQILSMRFVLAIFCFRGRRKGIILGEPLNIFLGGLQNVSFKLCNYSNRSLKKIDEIFLMNDNNKYLDHHHRQY